MELLINFYTSIFNNLFSVKLFAKGEDKQFSLSNFFSIFFYVSSMLRDASHYDIDQIWFVGISAMRVHRVFSWMRHDASEIKKSIFDAMLCFRTVDKVTEVGQKNDG